KNTTRIGGADPVADAAAVARAIYPGTTPDSRPDAVTLVPQDWATATAAAALMAPPVRAPLLFSDPKSLPAGSEEALRALGPRGSVAALRRHQQPKIYVLGPVSAVGEPAVKELRRLGKVKRIEGADPVRNSIAFARYLDGSFGWGIVDPGHGLVFVNRSQPLA